jgi:hypothetical protein
LNAEIELNKRKLAEMGWLIFLALEELQNQKLSIFHKDTICCTNEKKLNSDENFISLMNYSNSFS